MRDLGLRKTAHGAVFARTGRRGTAQDIGGLPDLDQRIVAAIEGIVDGGQGRRSQFPPRAPTPVQESCR